MASSVDPEIEDLAGLAPEERARALANLVEGLERELEATDDDPKADTSGEVETATPKTRS